MTLQALILLMATLFVTKDLQPVPARHLRKHELGAELRAGELAHDIEAAALAAGVPVRLYSAVLWSESAMDPGRVSSKGARAIPQLMPGTPWWVAWRRECRQPAHYSCEASSLFWGALALRESLDTCGGELAAVGRYRSGQCGTAGDAQGTLELARWIGEQLGDDEYATIARSDGPGEEPVDHARASLQQRASEESRPPAQALAACPPFYGSGWSVASCARKQANAVQRARHLLHGGEAVTRPTVDRDSAGSIPARAAHANESPVVVALESSGAGHLYGSHIPRGPGALDHAPGRRATFSRRDQRCSQEAA